MNYEEAVALIRRLQIHFALSEGMHRVRVKPIKAQVSRANYASNTIKLSVNDWHGMHDAALHEFAHLLSYHRHLKDGTGHGRRFRQALKDTIFASGMKLTDYGWHNEYRNVWFQAFRHGWTSQQWFQYAVRDEMSPNHKLVIPGDWVSFTTKKGQLWIGKVINAKQGCRAKVLLADGKTWYIPQRKLYLTEKPAKGLATMTNDGLLQEGQIIKIIDVLYRIDYVNECRARAVPITKKKVVDDDGEEGEKATRAINISPRSPVEVVTDIERAKDEIELAAAERELARLTRQAQLAAQATLAQQVSPKPAPKAQPTTVPAPTAAGAPRTGGGWRIGKVPHPPFKPDTLAAETMAVIQATPGLTTQQIVSAVKKAGAVASCVSRFMQAGYIERIP